MLLALQRRSTGSVLTNDTLRTGIRELKPGVAAPLGQLNLLCS